MNNKAVSEGVGDAMSFWLEQHPVTMAGLFELSIKKSVKDWMDDHEEEIIQAIKDSK